MIKIFPGISDHSAITWKLSFVKPRRTQSTYICRNIKAIDKETFAQNVADCNIISHATESVESAVHRYNSELGKLLDIHAPQRTRKARNHVDCPWYNADISTQKRVRRRLERKWRSNGRLQTDRDLLCAQRDLVNSLVRRAKRSYLVGLIDNCKDDSKKLFAVANKLLNRQQSSPLPTHTDSHEMASIFIHFFQAKVKTICDSFTPDETPPEPLTTSSFEIIGPTSPDEIMSLFRKLPPKSCQLDPIPTKLLMDCPLIFASIFSSLINMSLEQAHVPASLKVAHITPLLKKPLLDRNCLQNY